MIIQGIIIEYSKSLYELGKIEESNEKLQNAIDINPDLGVEYKNDDWTNLKVAEFIYDLEKS